MLFDQIHVLDALKTAKASLADSIAMAKHAQQQHNSSFGQQQQDQEEEADFDGLLEFLEDPWWCVKMLHSNTKQVNYQHRVVGRMVQYICESLTDKVGATSCQTARTFIDSCCCHHQQAQCLLCSACIHQQLLHHQSPCIMGGNVTMCTIGHIPSHDSAARNST